jgi:glycosyltransferase involved in cell wall biosynthesis
MKKLAIIDLMFRWPPDGGARVDVKETASRLALQYHVTLFVPRVKCVIERGDITGDMPFDVIPVPFEPRNFTGPAVAARFQSALKTFNPDLVFLADGFHLKPWAAMACKDYPYFVRFYAYENFCLRYNGTFMRGDRSCYSTGMRRRWLDKLYCTLCGSKTVLNDRLSGVEGFADEFIKARAWSLGHWSRTRRMLDNAGAIIVYNHLFKDIMEKCGWSPVVIPGGIRTENFPFTPFSGFHDPVRLGLIGRVNDMYKGVTPAMRVIGRLHREGVNAELHLTGEPDNALPVLPGVVFRGWFPPEAIHTFYQSVDICLVPSIWQEPFGIVALEAMCSGKPVIASNVAGLREIITHGETGLLAAPGSSADNAEAVIQLLRNPDVAGKLVDRAEKHVRRHYDWDTVVETFYLPLIERLINS